MDDLNEVLYNRFGLQGRLQKMPGYAEQNYKLISESGQKLVVKISHKDSDLDRLQYVLAIQEYVAKNCRNYSIPRCYYSIDGNSIVRIQDGRLLRVLSFVDGRMLSEFKPRSTQMFHEWGLLSGRIARTLQHFKHPTKPEPDEWDPSELNRSLDHINLIRSEEEKSIIRHVPELYDSYFMPKKDKLRKGYNHNDIHEHNILTVPDSSSVEISGLIDFGDSCYTYTINELAIACAYAAMYVDDPVEAMSHVVAGYHKACELRESELEVLFALSNARLLITFLQAAYRKSSDPGESYHLVHLEAAKTALQRLKMVSPDLAHCTFRSACGLEPNPDRKRFDIWIEKNKTSLHPVIKLPKEGVAKMDFSVGSADLGNNINFECASSFVNHVRRLMEDLDCTHGIGGYNEPRAIYTTDAYKVMGNHGAQWRTIHLGCDVWSVVGTPVYAPLDGVVDSSTDIAVERDYGPLIILRHNEHGSPEFHTLYGHLDRDSIKKIRPGQKIARGQKIAEIGSPPENGNWPPHLHFQVVLNLLNHKNDFPGVAFPHEAAVMLSNSPNPYCFFHYSKIEDKYFDTGDLMQKRRQVLGENLSVSYKKPIQILRAFRQYLYAEDGRRYLDTVNNVAHVGHEHPSVVASTNRQHAILNTNTRYLHPAIIQYAEKLLDTFPESLNKIYFTNSGSEANELALRMVRTYTGRQDMLAMEYGYHGNTGAAIDVSHYKYRKLPTENWPDKTHLLPLPNSNRYRDEPGNSQYEEVKVTLNRLIRENSVPAGFISECILSCAGQIELPESYLQYVYSLVRAGGGLCIADEVQTGFGRIGTHFWAFQAHDVVPDIVTLGKPMGNGYPLGAVICSDAVARAFNNGIEYFNTFGGNPVACQTGIAVMDVIESEHLQQNALETGNYLKSELKKLSIQFPVLCDIRGQGFFQGIELTTISGQCAPAPEQATYFVNRMRDRGILMSVDGYNENVIKIKPPMCFDRTNVNFLINNMKVVLEDNFLKIK